MRAIIQAQADTVLAAARDAARDTPTAMNIAVVDADGNLKAGVARKHRHLYQGAAARR